MLLLFFMLTLLIIEAYAQTDSTRTNTIKDSTFITKQLMPLGLIATGALLNIGDIKYKIRDKIPDTNNACDDYLQYVPIVQLYAFDAIGIDHQNSVFDQTKFLLIAQLVSSTTVHILKHITNVERPTGANYAFPSGHTTNAFVNATVLYLEFKDTEPLLAWSGYLFATATGTLRMTNDAHWLPDVLAGAGIGILTTNLVYYFKPLQDFQPFHKRKEVSITPVITPGAVALQCRF